MADTPSTTEEARTAQSGDPGPTTPGPARSRRRRGRFRSLPRWARVLIVIGSVLVIVSAAGAVGAWTLVKRYEGKVTKEDLLGEAAPPKDEKRWKSGPLNLLLLGSDSRKGETDKGKVAGERSDTIMLVHIAANRDTAAIISVPRDSWVDVPPGGPWKGGMNKLNAAFAFGGAPLAAKAITKLTGLPLDGAMVANFAGIRTMVDAVGGVRVCVEYDVESSFSDRVWKKGCHQMNGAQAEEFMRERFNVPGGDIGRAHQQQLVVKGIIEKVSAGDALSNPLTFDRLLVTAAKSLTIDNSLDLRRLALTVKDIRPASIKFATVPYRNLGLKTPAGSAVELHPVKAPAMFEALRADTVDQWLAANPPETRGKP